MNFASKIAGFALFAVLLSCAAPSFAQDSDARDSDHWLYNARERTAKGLEAHAENDATNADKAFASANRLADGHSVALYNVGTTRLYEEPEEAVRLLEESLSADPTLADGFYNLGVAKIQSGDPRTAVDAFQNALRIDPDHRDAKFNLEWALRQIEEEEQDGEDQQEQEEEEQEQQESQEEQEDQQEQEQESQQQEPDPEAPPQEQQQENSALPQFRDLPDMTAAEAAEILEAVENLEREERRKQALQSAQTTDRGRKDW